MLTDRVSALPPLKEVIDAHQLWAKKSLGQNFLLDLNLTRKIAKLAGDLSQSTIIEIGPGPGGLTRALFLEGAKKVIAIEQDQRAIQALQSLVTATEGALDLQQGDALKFDYSSTPGPKKIIANLPYNISTALLINWLKTASQFESLTLMFQKEVAERLMAEVSTSSYGRLSVMTQWRATVRRGFDIPPEAFKPAPKVTSTVVHIIPKPAQELTVDFSTLEKITATAFNQRRKMIRSSLKPVWGDATEETLKAHQIDPCLRAENLTLQDYVRLAELLEKKDSL